MPEQQLFSVPEVAIVLGVSEHTAWNLVYRRELGTVRIGRLRKVSRKDLDKYIESKTIPPKK